MHGSANISNVTMVRLTYLWAKRLINLSEEIFAKNKTRGRVTDPSTTHGSSITAKSSFGGSPSLSRIHLTRTSIVSRLTETGETDRERKRGEKKRETDRAERIENYLTKV